MFNFFKRTPTLIESAKKGNLDNVRRHLEEGADVNARDRNGTTALMWACEKGHTCTDIALEILKRDDVDLRGCGKIRLFKTVSRNPEKNLQA